MKISKGAFPLVATLGLLGAASTQGCAGVDTSTSAEEDLTAAGKKLIGAHVATATTPSGAHFRGLVLSKDPVTSNANVFVAEVDTGIVCITAPCPSSAHVTGRFTAGSKTITLTADGDVGPAASLMGKYNYTRTATKLTLSRTGFKQVLANAPSFCSADNAEEDCNLQNLSSDCPDTVSWSCSDTNRCEPSCDTQGKFCGGFAGIQCSGGLVCKHPVGMCGVADGGGTCSPIPKCNPDYMDPVCSCDQQTYNNGCVALAAGAEIDHAGACSP